jgi:hypothetical protein
MRIPRFWAAKVHESFKAFGSSNESLEDARNDASRRARKIADFFRSGRDLPTYPYAERRIREEILFSLRHDGAEHALVTRNSYGALVLNSSSVVFADIDFPPEKSRGASRMGAWLGRLFGGGKQAEGADLAWGRIRRWSESNPAIAYRLYRTHAGLRMMLTGRRQSPTAAETLSLFEEIGADPQYVRLTKAQECFRARLTPKPWRCGCPMPPHRFPFDVPQAEDEQRAWEREYDALRKSYGVCHLIGEHGAAASDPVIVETIRVHDEHAGAADGTPLA